MDSRKNSIEVMNEEVKTDVKDVKENYRYLLA